MVNETMQWHWTLGSAHRSGAMGTGERGNMAMGERLTVAEAASALGMPATLIVRRALDGRLPSTGSGAARTFARGDVDALAAREREVDEALRLAYEAHADVETDPSAGP